MTSRIRSLFAANLKLKITCLRMMMEMMMRMSQKIALKSLKIEYVVAWGISLDILVQQMREKKSYGFTAI